MAIWGHCDGMEGGYAVGWAAPSPDAGAGVCTVTLVAEGGEVVGKGRATRERGDLAPVLGRTNAGFRVALAKRAYAHARVHVLADGVELGGSPLALGPGLYSAGVWQDGDFLGGWVSERVAEPQPLEITVRNQHGEVIGAALTAFEPNPEDPVFAPSTFSFKVSNRVYGAGEQLLTVLANGRVIGLLDFKLGLDGRVEVLSADTVAGWLVCPQVPHRVFVLEVFRDGKKIGETACDTKRHDVKGVYPGCYKPGFSFALPKEGRAEDGSAVVSLRLKGADRDLFEGPYLLGPRGMAAAAVQKAAGLVHLPGLSAAERAVLGLALGAYKAEAFVAPYQRDARLPAPPAPRLVIIIPVYKGVAVTRACVESVLAQRGAEDQVVLINDASPEPEMGAMLGAYAGREGVIVLQNAENLGFVKTVNRGLDVALGADVVLLNSDTVVFAGAFDELHRVAHAAADVGTVTALSNNATIFSYPSRELRGEVLDDISWPELAAVALRENGGKTADVPTGHGFCLFIKGEVTRRLGGFDEGFGRGYCEENDFCARAAALGYRSVAAGGVLVEHKESVSFGEGREALLTRNVWRLETLHPDYTDTVVAFEKADGLRSLRWRLDAARLRLARAAGARFALVVSNALEGGTARAIGDIAATVGYGGAEALNLRVSESGLMELSAQVPLLHASFAPEEVGELWALLDAAAPTHVYAHQLLGFPQDFVEGLIPWLEGRHSVFWAHDFYAVCPRVTMIDAIGQFCDAAPTDTCARCVEMGGAHEYSVLTGLTPAQHRALLGRVLGAFSHVIAPSPNTARYFTRVFPELTVTTLAHPEGLEGVAAARRGDAHEIVLLGAIGAHKGSALLLQIARRARLVHPQLRFRVIGYTDMDATLEAVGNVMITGKFTDEDLPGLLAETPGYLGLFLSNWPETYSYTLSELVRHGFVPLVPDIGAPAERVRVAKYGVVFPYPATPEAVLGVIDNVVSGRSPAYAKGATPRRFFAGGETAAQLAALMGV